MTAPILYPIGIQTFSQIIEGGYVYADKTGILYDLVKRSKYVFLSRPRRFGKSLFLSTLEAYFQGKKELFKGLQIDALEKDWESHPVLRLDFNGMTYNSISSLKDKIESELIEWERTYGVRNNVSDISVRFSNVIKSAFENTGKRVVILIDEYDKPLLENMYEKNLFNELRDELRGFYSVLKRNDEFIRFGMLTGVSKFGQLTVFSGLNNLNDITFSKRYNSVCGITEEEMVRYFSKSVEEFSEEQELSEEDTLRLFKENYDGYHFHEKGADIYNPFSVLRAFDSGEIDDYWYSTGNPSFLIKVLKEENFPVKELDNAERTREELEDMTYIHGDIVPLFFQTGYLTIKDKDNKSNRYRLCFPNKEVKKAFWRTLATYYFPKLRTTTEFDLYRFRNDLEKGNIEEFLTRLRSLFATRNPGAEADKEVHFENMMAIFTMMLGFEVQTQVLNDKGRTDMTVFTDDYIYIMEFKVDSSAEEALKQIRDREYWRRYEIDNRKIILAGINFATQERNLNEWLIEEFK